VSDILREFRFDPLLTLSSVNPRALCCVASLNFDRTNAEERARAAVCHQKLLDSLAARGYFPYRLPTAA
jgi:hypothetical protein